MAASDATGDMKYRDAMDRLRKADLIRHLDRRLNPTLQDAMQRTEALKRKSPQPIIPINPKIN
jgi:hypothetical protein